jgi:plastocyanin
MAARGVIAVCALSLASLACRAEPNVRVIDVSRLAFRPVPERLHVNDDVEWVNEDIFRHIATVVDGRYNIDLPVGGKSDNFNAGRRRKLLLSLPSGDESAAGVRSLKQNEETATLPRPNYHLQRSNRLPPPSRGFDRLSTIFGS